MCGRFALGRNRNEIRSEMPDHNLDIDEWEGEEDFVPRYNIAPRSRAPVIRRRVHGLSDQPDLVMHTMKWGLVPHWSKKDTTSLSTINARADKLIEGQGMWASLRGKKRCVVPCQGYYEWLTKGKQKTPYFSRRKDGKLMLLAGLYDSTDIDGDMLWTFTIVTTDANKEFAWLHDRQPVILSSAQAVSEWLDTSSQSWSKQLAGLLGPYRDPDVPLECYQVPQEVGKVGNESPTFVEPITARKDGLHAMFAKQKVKTEDSTGKTKRRRSSTPVEDESQEDTKPAKKIKEDIPETPRKNSVRISSNKVKSPSVSSRPPGTQPITSFFTKPPKK